MFFLTFLLIFLYIHSSDGQNVTEDTVQDVRVHDIAGALFSLLGQDCNETERIKELKEKLMKIDNYVVDKLKYAELLLNSSKYSELNSTNFYNALIDKDYFRINNESKNLYLKLKENMNRDDVLNILAKRGKDNVMKSARRMISEVGPKNIGEKGLNDIVDKYLGQAPHDDHTFTENDSNNKYWDPQVELEERHSYLQPETRRLFKGERTTIRYYPFVVSVHVMGLFWCGGSLYKSDLVLTSASCLQLMHNNRFYRENPKSLMVRVGSNHSRVGGESIDTLEVYFHPAYNPRTLNNNLAIVRLRRHVQMTHHRIPKLIAISTNEGGVPNTAQVILLGWGVTKTSQKLAYEPIFLQRKVLPIYPQMFCREVYGTKFILDTMFCAGTLTTGEGACDHDAGGPAILNGKLVGIISFGPALCGFPDAPTVFTLVGAYSDWIETIHESKPEYYTGRKKTTLSTADPFVAFFSEATHFSLLTEAPETTEAPKLTAATPATDHPPKTARDMFRSGKKKKRNKKKKTTMKDVDSAE